MKTHDSVSGVKTTSADPQPGTYHRNAATSMIGILQADILQAGILQAGLLQAGILALLSNTVEL